MCVQFSETKTQLHTGLGSLRWSEWGWTWQRQQKTQQGVRCFYFKQGECTSSLSVHHHYLFIIVICSPSLSVHHQYLFIIIICSSSLSVHHPYLFIILICSSSLFVNPHYLFIIIIIIYLAKWRRRLCLTTDFNPWCFGSIFCMIYLPATFLDNPASILHLPVHHIALIFQVTTMFINTSLLIIWCLSLSYSSIKCSTFINFFQATIISYSGCPRYSYSSQKLQLHCIQAHHNFLIHIPRLTAT